MTDQKQDRLLSVQEVIPTVGFGRTKIYQMVRTNRPDCGFPKPIKIGHQSFWKHSDIQNWIAELNSAPATTPNA